MDKKADAVYVTMKTKWPTTCAFHSIGSTLIFVHPVMLNVRVGFRQLDTIVMAANI